MAGGSGSGGVIECERVVEVPREYAAAHLREHGIEVLSTPCMVLLMERLARECLDARLPDGVVSVGVRVDVRHRAPVRVGESVLVRARGFDAGGGRFLFLVSVSSGGRLIGEAVHERRVVGLDDYLRRLQS